ncbi:PD-(D/E)XK nuclease family protein [Alteraurantiacibacter aquimixticola]|uniref:Double-strand break repair protein AddB n=1 Tax=Alteraurantiacibacter aquimixticola TaxID=2489173 RepID=A0A4T3F411_9SPHN|nr:PD-(D/E)XK nuclease family protein [Alteraurantiacibacter aquimixticola]TIX52035.1 double-strand break repair protein AddB [Alteraurantiacibacter aquimixticola]
MAGARPEIYSIAAHRGFADALVAGLVPRYSEAHFGLARTTLILPSARAMRTMGEAFIRHFGEHGQQGLLMPRMAVVGDLDLDETLGPLLDSLGAALDVPPAADPTYRWLRLAELIRKHRGDGAPGEAGLLRLAFTMGQVMDRLLVEDIAPEQLVKKEVLDLLPEVSTHWIHGLKLFMAVQDDWLEELQERGEVDAATRRNLLFDAAAQRLRENPPATPIIAAGVTSAAPALARLLRVIADLPQGAVVLPDLDLSMSQEVWDELGEADGQGAETPFARDDALTHPQYHLKLLLNRMGVARAEVEPWHRAGLGKGPPERSHAISSLFLPPEASKAWAELPSEKRRLAGVRMMECAHPEEEAQAIALLVRQALEEPGKRVAVITPDRGLAGRVVQHLKRWNIEADDTAGRPLAQTPAGRVLLLLAEVAADQASPVELVALLEHPLVRRGEQREAWLKAARALELRLRGPRPEPGLEPLRALAVAAGHGDWWQEVETILGPLMLPPEQKLGLAEALDLLATAGEALCGEDLWSQEDGRTLARMVENLRLHARATETRLAVEELPGVLRDAMDREAVRPPYGGHPRIALYGLLESRMTRADLVICAGLNEGTWPATPAADPVLAPAILRVLGVPGADFRIGLAAHDLAGALGAPEVVLSRAQRDAGGPVIASRFWLRVQALLGRDLLPRYMDGEIVSMAQAVDEGESLPAHPRPDPKPTAAQRRENLSVTALDRLRSDPYQFYAQKILKLRELDLLDAEPSPAWQGTLAHAILEQWHQGTGTLEELAEHHLHEMRAHPLMRALWRPRLMKALEWIKAQIEADPARVPVAWEVEGEVTFKGVTITGKADRIDLLPDRSLAIVDYKTGSPPSGREVEAGFAMQLGTLGLMATEGAFGDVRGKPAVFEYWSLGKSDTSETGFGYIKTPLKIGNKRTGIAADKFLPEAQRFLTDAIDRWILGEEGFTARLNPAAKVYAEYDHLMRLDEWMGREDGDA